MVCTKPLEVRHGLPAKGSEKGAEQAELCIVNILKAKLIYVTEPDHEQLEGIQSFLCKEFHKKTVQLSMEEDQKLLGGFILKAEDVEYDYSLKAQLKQLFGA